MVVRSLSENRGNLLLLVGLASAAIVVTFSRSASSFIFQAESDPQMLLYRLNVGCVLAVGLILYFLISKYALFAMMWSGLKAMAHHAAGVGRTIFVRCLRFLLSLLELSSKVTGSIDQQSPRFTACSLAIFFSPKHWPYRLYPLSCTLLE